MQLRKIQSKLLLAIAAWFAVNVSRITFATDTPLLQLSNRSRLAIPCRAEAAQSLSLSDISKREYTHPSVGLKMYAIRCSASTDRAPHARLDPVNSELTVYSGYRVLTWSG